MGPSDLRVIPFDKVWVPDDQTQIKAYLKSRRRSEPTFAGEQADHAPSIVSLTRNSKPKLFHAARRRAADDRRACRRSSAAGRCRISQIDFAITTSTCRKRISRANMRCRRRCRASPRSPSRRTSRSRMPSGWSCRCPAVRGQPPTTWRRSWPSISSSGGSAMVMLLAASRRPGDRDEGLWHGSESHVCDHSRRDRAAAGRAGRPARRSAAAAIRFRHSRLRRSRDHPAAQIPSIVPGSALAREDSATPKTAKSAH